MCLGSGCLIDTHRIWYIYLHENHKFQPHVGKYTIHGSYGIWKENRITVPTLLLLTYRKRTDSARIDQAAENSIEFGHLASTFHFWGKYGKITIGMLWRFSNIRIKNKLIAISAVGDIALVEFCLKHPMKARLAIAMKWARIMQQGRVTWSKVHRTIMEHYSTLPGPCCCRSWLFSQQSDRVGSPIFSDREKNFVQVSRSPN